MSNQCAYCDARATKLCDYTVKGKSCDRPLCDAHALEVRTLLICARPRSKSFVDTIDYCPEHCSQNRDGHVA